MPKLYRHTKYNEFGETLHIKTKNIQKNPKKKANINNIDFACEKFIKTVGDEMFEFKIKRRTKPKNFSKIEKIKNKNKFYNDFY